MAINEDPFYEGRHVLTHDHYLALLDIRDKLMVMAQLAGSRSTLHDTTSHILVRRALLGEMFGDFSNGIGAVLESVASEP